MAAIPKIDIVDSQPLRAQRLDQSVTRWIRVVNPVPESLLTGTCQVEPHPQDPAPIDGRHAWLEIHPSSFTGNQVDIQIRADTSRLRADQVYYRYLQIHSNASPRPVIVPFSVETAPLPRNLYPFSLILAGIVPLFLGWFIEFLFHTFDFRELSGLERVLIPLGTLVLVSIALILPGLIAGACCTWLGINSGWMPNSNSGAYGGCLSYTTLCVFTLFMLLSFPRGGQFLGEYLTFTLGSGFYLLLGYVAGELAYNLITEPQQDGHKRKLALIFSTLLLMTMVVAAGVVGLHSTLDRLRLGIAALPLIYLQISYWWPVIQYRRSEQSRIDPHPILRAAQR